METTEEDKLVRIYTAYINLHNKSVVTLNNAVKVGTTEINGLTFFRFEALDRVFNIQSNNMLHYEFVIKGDYTVAELCELIDGRNLDD